MPEPQTEPGENARPARADDGDADCELRARTWALLSQIESAEVEFDAVKRHARALAEKLS